MVIKQVAKVFLDRCPTFKSFLLDQYKVRRFQLERSRMGKWFTRKRNPVVFNDLSSVELASDVFGNDRGSSILNYYIHKFIDDNESAIQGRVLEVQDRSISKRFKHKGIQMDVLHVEEGNPEATLVGDLTRPETLPTNQFDCFICTSTFNHIFEIEKAIQTSYQLLKPGGVLLATLPCLAQIARYDMDRWGDYWRPTSKACDTLFSKTFKQEHLKIQPYGNVLSAIALLQGFSIEDLPKASLLDEQQKDYEVMIGICARKEP